MSNPSSHPFPKLHNAMWPGLVGKGGPGGEPPFDLDTMLNLTAAAEVNGVRFEGVDIFLFEPHINIDVSDDDLKRISEKVRAKGFVVGSVVAPIWPPTGGGSAMGSAEDRKKFVEQVRKGCRIAARLRELGTRPYGVVRLDSASGVDDWAKDPEGNTRLIAQTFREACEVAEGFGERLAAEGEICWGAMHSWRQMVKLLEAVGRPKTLGFQADMAHTLLYTLGYNAPEDRILPAEFTWDQTEKFQEALRSLAAALRPWTIDFHVAQNDGTVKGSGSHDKTGHHCLPNDPNGKLNIAHDAGYWMRDEAGNLTKAFKHICWDGCMFSNETMMKPETWNSILAAMIAVRDAHGWSEELPVAAPSPVPSVAVVSSPVAKAATKPAAAKRAPAPARKPTRKPPVKPAVRTAAKPAAKPAQKARPMKAKAAARPTPKISSKPVAKKPTKPSPGKSVRGTSRKATQSVKKTTKKPAAPAAKPTTKTAAKAVKPAAKPAAKKAAAKPAVKAAAKKK